MNILLIYLNEKANDIISWFYNKKRFKKIDNKVYRRILENIDNYQEDAITLNGTVEEAIKMTNKFLNKTVVYSHDKVNYSKDPIITLYDGEGDCEDIARLSTELLALFKAKSVIAYSKSGGHAFSVVQTVNGVMAIDSTSMKNHYLSEKKFASIEDMLHAYWPQWEWASIKNIDWKTEKFLRRKTFWI